jgi:hypothetical protein
MCKVTGILPELIIVMLTLTACHTQPDNTAKGDWIKGNQTEKVKTIEKQFRGFDVAMVETGYRYQELYWAGHDENWDYAAYQVGKIKVAIENGLERRPNRAASAGHFLDAVLPEMQQAISTKDSVVFNQSFRTLTIQCNSCHAIEHVSFFTVKPPTTRQSPIRN